MSSGSDVQVPALAWSACGCGSAERCSCGAREDPHAALREEVTGHFLALRYSVYRYLRHLGCTGSDAEDITQDTFLWLYRARLNGQRINGDNLRPLVFTVARRRSIDRLRRQRVERPLFLELSGDLADTLHDEGHKGLERRALLKEAIQELSDLQHECLHFRAEGLSLRETSAIVGVAEKRVSEAVQRGIRRLRRVLFDGPPK